MKLIKRFSRGQGDLISVRGLGRIKILRLLGETKKVSRKSNVKLLRIIRKIESLKRLEVLMALNSLDVQNKTFNTQMRGYSKHEIEEFLDIIVRDYDEFAQKIKEQDRELKSLRERVRYFDDMKDSLNKSIVVAQDAADNLRVQAQSESNSIIAEASQKVN